MNEIDIFARQIEALKGRLVELYQDANVSSPPIEYLLPSAFKELGTVSEKLQIALEELWQQNEELISAQEALVAERDRYQELFEFAPDALLVTDTQGKIREANRAAAKLLNISQEHLLTKPLVVFIAPEQRWNFRTQLNRQCQGEHVQNWQVRLKPRDGEWFDAAIAAIAVRDREGRPVTLRWLLRQIGNEPQREVVSEANTYPVYFDRPVQVYSKGEMIPFNPQAIWQVRHGLVKLTTLNDTGDEVLVGLAGPNMPFGSSLTSLMTYQATALSKQVQLVEISLTEIATSPDLAQALLPHIQRRLKQTELLLAIFGKRRVQERLRQLLLLLKQEIGELTKQGTRLSVRLTHEDLANACCTTRVTMTRLLNQLQEEGKLFFDSDRHLILQDGSF